MQPIAEKFIFSSYNLAPKERKVFFNYRIEFANRELLKFTETIVLPKAFDQNKIPTKLLHEVLASTHVILGISYYKLYCPKKIITQRPLSEQQAYFFNTVYRKGLGEFFYRNNIDPTGLIEFPFDSELEVRSVEFKRKKRILMGIGGGKDSIVVGELLKEQGEDITALLVETQRSSPISEKVVQEMEVPQLKIERFLDEKIFQQYEGSYNGHVPISAIFAFLGFLAAVVYDYAYVVVGNEFSSNFGNIDYKGEEINHQWSKSEEFEILFQEYSKNFLCPDITYFSPLRPFYEIRIAKMFAAHKKYFPYFSSCNRSFRIHKEKQDKLWCGECPKCVFVFTLLSAFLSKEELVEIFGKNLYEKERLLLMFRDVLGFGGTKPFDCVGTFEEAQAAFFLAGEKFKGDFVMEQLQGMIKNGVEKAQKLLKTNIVKTVPAEYAFLGMESALILGYGREGKATEKYLQKKYPKLKIGIADQDISENYLANQDDFDIAIKTPGIPKGKLAILYTTATNIFFSKVDNVIVGVTGSKGKSTTSSLIHAILKESGMKVSLLGNIGNPMLDMLLQPIKQDEIFVLELSSYQLDDLKYSPNISVVLNLFPEHMNYHGGVEQYYEAKRNITRFQKKSDVFVYNDTIETLCEWTKAIKSETIAYNNEEIKKFEHHLLGEHNKNNIRAAVVVAKKLGVSEKDIFNALKKFKSLPHRLELVGEFSGIKFYDDAISTTPESTIMAIKALKKVDTIFLGGEDRGYNFLELEKELHNAGIRNIVLFPESGKRILSSKDDFNILETKSMQEAVAFAFKNTKAKHMCLLSTASPSYSLWKNFEEKGSDFQFCIKEEFNKKRS